MKHWSLFLKVVLCVMLIVGLTLLASCDMLQNVLEQMGGVDFPFGNISNLEEEKIDADTAYLTEVREYISGEDLGKSKVVMNLSAISSTNIEKTVTIGEGIAEITFKGDSNRSYTAINVVVQSYSTDALTITFKNMNMSGDSPDGTVFCSNGRKLIIRSEGSANSIYAGANASAIAAPTSDIVFEGNAMLTLNGGRGLDGRHGEVGKENHGSAGGIGGTALIASRITKQGTFSLRLVGGVGGDGGDGNQGENGSNGTNGDGNIWVQHTKPVGSAGNGTAGFDGGNGGNGGDGGYPIISTCTINILEGSLHMQVGNGGNGGHGGTGGYGGSGGKGSDADKGSMLFGAGWTYGSNGGNGGRGGNGGVGGNGGRSDATRLSYNVTVSPGAQYVLSSSSHGAGGNGGLGGDGGNGGSGGSCDTVRTGDGCGYNGYRCTCGGRGGNGGSGGNGGIGGNGSVAGYGGSAGNGGSGGYHRTSLFTCSCAGDGRSGESGKAGSMGSVVTPVQDAWSDSSNGSYGDNTDTTDDIS